MPFTIEKRNGRYHHMITAVFTPKALSIVGYQFREMGSPAIIQPDVPPTKL
ncbi:MAG: hypothetical protein H6665_02775 [Ardenticatenaceae bacterium]|nr:hypothetical protein [Ardenticatenaceae bacterium]